ncbi:MAG: signal recognition particle-docking protein FtsY [Ignavibacteriae bacterium]|nr:signal recognition particle-docking protein FtsY [Ignavibacteriota bacterium]
MGLLDKIGFERLKVGLSKTREGLLDKVTRLVMAKATIDDDLLDQLEEILIGADVGVDTTMRIVESIKGRIREERYTNADELQFLLHDEIQRQFANGSSADNEEPVDLPSDNPYVIMVVGINGVGKTTTIGKLAHRYASAGRKVVIGAADTFRAAANEQLEIWAQRAGATIIRQLHGSDPAAVAFDAVKSAVASGADVVIIDTAGRLHTKANLMEELKKIRRVIGKQNPAMPHEVLLVIDASTGQNGLQQAKQFGAAVGVTGLVLTKLDGTAKGGIVLAITRGLSLPVRFIGVGEQIEDLQPFDRKAFVDALFER